VRALFLKKGMKQVYDESYSDLERFPSDFTDTLNQIHAAYCGKWETVVASPCPII